MYSMVIGILGISAALEILFIAHIIALILLIMGKKRVAIAPTILSGSFFYLIMHFKGLLTV